MTIRKGNCHSTDQRQQNKRGGAFVAGCREEKETRSQDGLPTRDRDPRGPGSGSVFRFNLDFMGADARSVVWRKFAMGEALSGSVVLREIEDMDYRENCRDYAPGTD